MESTKKITFWTLSFIVLSSLSSQKALLAIILSHFGEKGNSPTGFLAGSPILDCAFPGGHVAKGSAGMIDCLHTGQQISVPGKYSGGVAGTRLPEPGDASISTCFQFRAKLNGRIACETGGCTMDIQVRAARPDDAEGIISVLNPIIESGAYTVLDAQFTVKEERDFIERFPDRGVFHVAERRADRIIVGFQSIEPYAVYTRAFDHVAVIGTFVHLSYRRNRIGLRLSEATFERARQMGYEKLFTHVRADNPESLAFHIKLGFRIIGAAHGQARLGRSYVDEIYIEKFL